MFVPLTQTHSSLPPWSTSIKLPVRRLLLHLVLVIEVTNLSAEGYYDITTSVHFGNGTNNNTFTYVDSAGNTYNRRVDAAYNNITLDQKSGSLA